MSRFLGSLAVVLLIAVQAEGSIIVKYVGTSGDWTTFTDELKQFTLVSYSGPDASVTIDSTSNSVALSTYVQAPAVLTYQIKILPAAASTFEAARLQSFGTSDRTVTETIKVTGGSTLATLVSTDTSVLTYLFPLGITDIEITDTVAFSGGGPYAAGISNEFTTTPEPASLAIWGVLAGGALVVGRRRRRA